MARTAKQNECRSGGHGHGDRADDAKLRWKGSVVEATQRGSTPWDTEGQQKLEGCDHAEACRCKPGGSLREVCGEGRETHSI